MGDVLGLAGDRGVRWVFLLGAEVSDGGVPAGVGVSDGGVPGPAGGRGPRGPAGTYLYHPVQAAQRGLQVPVLLRVETGNLKFLGELGRANEAQCCLGLLGRLRNALCSGVSIHRKHLKDCRA